MCKISQIQSPTIKKKKTAKLLLAFMLIVMHRLLKEPILLGSSGTHLWYQHSEAQAGRSQGVWCQPGLQSKFKDSLFSTLSRGKKKKKIAGLYLKSPQLWGHVTTICGELLSWRREWNQSHRLQLCDSSTVKKIFPFCGVHEGCSLQLGLRTAHLALLEPS